jgi:histidine triad (HIT) family protein
VTPFDLTPEEWVDIWTLVQRMRTELDQRLRPDGYNLGWNCGEAAGQEVPHAHLHLIPRYVDEPLAGKGICYAIKQPSNARAGVPGPASPRTA